MILGTSAYKNGARATTFRPKVDAGLGYLKGEENAPQVVRTYYLNDADTERAAKRARALREAAGTLSGVALGEDDSRRSAATSWPTWPRCSAAPGAALAELADRLAERFPERWDGTTGDAVSADAAPAACRAWSSRWAASGAAAAAPRRRDRGERHMTRYRGNAAVAAPDQRKHQAAVAGVAAAPSLTCAVTGNGTRPEMTEAAAPWGSRRAPASEHRYQLCDDEFCDRFPCRVYKEGYADGYDDGHRRGYDEGYAAGYAEGFGDGMAACPRRISASWPPWPLSRPRTGVTWTSRGRSCSSPPSSPCGC